MEVSGFIVFGLALAIAAGSPGPSIAALVARVLSAGWRDVMPFVAAMWAGELVWLLLALAGLSAIAESFQTAFAVIRWCGVAWLMWLAWKMWFAPVQDGDDLETVPAGSAWRMFLSGLAVTLGNPKIMVFYLALLPTIIDLGGVTMGDSLALALVTLFVLAAVDLAWVFLAARARVLLKSARARRITNRISASVLGGAAAAIAVK